MIDITKNDMDYALSIATKLYPWQDKSYPLWQECESAAMYGLAKASKAFDPDFGASWKTYVFIKVKSAVLDALRDEMISSGAGLARGRIRGREPVEVVSIDNLINIGDGTDISDQLIRKEDYHLCLEALNSLPKNLRDTCYLYYIEDETMAAIGNAFGVTLQAIHGRIDRAKKIMKQYILDETGGDIP